MLIISQNKKGTINLGKVIMLRSYTPKSKIHKNKTNIIAATSIGFFTIGRYDTEERADEILSEIINKYQQVTRVDEGKMPQPKFYTVPKVYYMPEQ